MPRPAPGAGEWGRALEDRPAAGGAGFNLFAEHATDHRAASGRAARAGAGAGSPAHHRKSFRATLYGLDDDPLADFVAQANRPVGVDDRLYPGLSGLVGSIQRLQLLDDSVISGDSMRH